MAVTPTATYVGLAIAAASTAYGINAQEQAKKAAGKNMPKAPIEAPKRPQVTSFQTDLQKSQALAASAGGTILSDPEKNRRTIGNDTLAPRKSLLGS